VFISTVLIDMPCPYAGAGDSREAVDRDDFLRSTLVIGGGDALQATLMRYGPPDRDPTGAPPATGGQYDWRPTGATEAADCPVDHADDADAAHAADARDHGDEHEETERADDTEECPVDHAADADDEYDDFESDWPAYHVVYRLTHRGDDPDRDRRRLVEGLRSVTEQVGWRGDGVTWAVGYAPRFLEESDAAVPAGLRTDPVGSVAADGGRAVGGDCLVHLASDEPRTLLLAETVLWGETEGLGVDVAVSDPFGDAFHRPASAPERRVTISPHGVDAPSVDGDAVVELSAFDEDAEQDPEATPTDDHTGDADGCPVDHAGAGDGHDHAGDDTDDAVDLRHLNPASPGVLRVALCSPEESDPDAERYYVPSAGDRVLAGE